MNNKILKSLRHTMLSTVAAAIVSIGFTACSDEMTLTKNSSAPADGYQVCIPASIGGGETRAIAYNSETGGYDATFETTDAIIAYYRTDNFALNSREPLKPDVNGKSANLVGKLEFYSYNPDTQTETLVTPAVGDELHLFYKSTAYFDYSRDFSNQWDMETDYAEATVTITAINDGTITTSPATFRNCQSIFDVNFSGIASGVKIKKMMIASNLDKLVSSYNILDPYQQDRFGSVTYTYKNEGIDQHKLTFLLRFATNPNSQSSEPGDVITFKAVGSDGHVYSGTKSVSADLENGKYYHADVAMADLGLAMTLTNNTTGELLDLSNYIGLDTRDYSYTATNNGYGTCIEWYGGDQELILKDLNMYNSNDGAIAVKCNEADPTNIIVHNLVLEGVNTLNVTGYHTSLTVQYNCSLKISSRSSGKLILKADDMGLNLWDNGTVLTIESGEVTVDGRFGIGTNSSCVITNSGKLRVLTQKNYSSEGIKAGSGYVLQTATEGDYTVYTVTAAPAYEDPKALNTVTTEDIGKIIGSDGKVHVPHWDLPEGISPVGVITHISSEGHGLAIANEPIIIKKERDGWLEPIQYFSWDNSAGANDGKTATDIFDEWKNNNPVPNCEWRLATKEEWQNMVISCGISGDATTKGENMVANGLATILKSNGFIPPLNCWTNTQSENSIWSVMIDSIENQCKLSFSPNSTQNILTLLPVLEFGQ